MVCQLVEITHKYICTLFVLRNLRLLVDREVRNKVTPKLLKPFVRKKLYYGEVSTRNLDFCNFNESLFSSKQ